MDRIEIEPINFLVVGLMVIIWVFILRSLEKRTDVHIPGW